MRTIDADALKKDLTRFYDNEVTAKQLIDEQPTIEPERKKGMWFLTDSMYACNRCHSVFYETSPFCPNCGAEMKGEE